MLVKKAALAVALILISVRFANAQDNLSLWMKAVQEHRSGTADTAAFQIARWSTPELRAVVADAKKYVRELEKSRRAEGNRILLRGAFLHSDIVELIPEYLGSGSSPESVVVVGDGRQIGLMYPTIHWSLGRSLLDSVWPTPASERDVLIWYRHAASYLTRTRAHSEALAHLERARQLFPEDLEILLNSAYLHEKLASPVIQAAAASIDPLRGTRAAVNSKSTELERAEKFFRQALAIVPENAEARVRLGRVVGQLGRHREAAAELKHAIKLGLRSQFLYLAQLFLGREEEVLGNRAAARECFERALKLYPRAQSPRLSLSQLARQSGDRPGALRALQPLSERSVDQVAQEDPWWTYLDVQ
jgi:tetratricopeptide (TPR) repeat protein